MILLLFSIFYNPFENTKEISWLQFEQKMLSQSAVDKIVVINKETAEIYIKADKIGSGEF